MLIFSWSRAQTGQPAKKKMDPATAPELEKCVPSDVDARETAFREMCDARNHKIGVLLLLVQEIKGKPDEHRDQTRLCTAIRMLGELRAKNAAGPLMDVIDLKFTYAATHTGAPGDSPVIQALADIGKPASIAAIEYLAKDDRLAMAPRYVRVITLVEGVEVGRFMVQGAAEKELNRDRRARLLKGVELFDKAHKVIQ